MKNQSFAIRLRYALGGIRAAFGSEASFRTQLALAALAGRDTGRAATACGVGGSVRPVRCGGFLPRNS